ncbi:caspase family protein [Corallococcus sp. AB038B]|uniref:caspase family protein n=1 Tax=Corallococcus sp. AB038B TaxID=2316718 RepID=UPI0013155EFC|nr:caspase family protein [Corallococcus sp. AB038B]
MTRRPAGMGRALLVANRTIPGTKVELNGTVMGARLVEAALKQAKLESVVVKTELTADELKTLLKERSRDTAEERWSFFHYGGHALQWMGKNYLLMADFPFHAPPSDAAGIARALKKHAVLVDDIVAFAPPQAHPNVVIIDACRTNPFPKEGALGKSWNNGLQEEENTKGRRNTLVAHSVGPSGPAPDPLREPSEYTYSLAILLNMPGATLLGVLPELHRKLRFSAQAPGYTSNVNSEDDVQFRELASVLVSMAADDEALLLLNDRIVGNSRLTQPFPVTLEPGENVFTVRVYNQRTFTGGFEPWGGHQREGWSMALTLTGPEQPEPWLRLSEQEPTPAAQARHGTQFDVATFRVDLDPDTGQTVPPKPPRILWRDNEVPVPTAGISQGG